MSLGSAKTVNLQFVFDDKIKNKYTIYNIYNITYLNHLH